MSDAGLERLRASRKKVAEINHARGVAAGKQWALERAEYDDLERVANIENRDPRAIDDYLGFVGVVAGAAIGDDHPSGEQINDWVEDTFGPRDPSDDELMGFVEGAGEVFDKV